MTIDVVIPVFNGEMYIRECINSVIPQIQNGKIIIVDDGSFDSTPEILATIKSHNSCVEIISTPNGGLSRARNTGWSFSSAPYVAFLDSDDIYLPGKLDSHRKHLEAHGNCILSFSHALEFETSIEFANTQPDNTIPYSFSDLLLGNYRVEGSGSSVVIKRSALEAIGGFNEKLRYGEDWDLWLRLSSGNYLCEIDEFLTAVRLNPNGMQRTQYRGIENFKNSYITFYEWENYPEIFTHSEFANSARRIIWSEIRRNFKQPKFLFFKYSEFVRRDFPSIYEKLQKIFGRRILWGIILQTIWVKFFD